MAQNQTNCCHFPTSFSGLLTALNILEINLNFSNNGTMRTKSALQSRSAGGFQLYDQEPLWNLASAFKATLISTFEPLSGNMTGSTAHSQTSKNRSDLLIPIEAEQINQFPQHYQIQTGSVCTLAPKLCFDQVCCKENTLPGVYSISEGSATQLEVEYIDNSWCKSQSEVQKVA